MTEEQNPERPIAIDFEAATELARDAARSGEALDLYVPGVPGLVIRGVQPRNRATFGKSFFTVFPEGLAFTIWYLTQRELSVFAVLALVQEYGDTPIPLRNTDIAARIGITPSAVSKAVARMRKLGILQSGRTKDGQPMGLRISRRVLFRGNAFHFCELGQDPPLFDPDEAPIIRRMRRGSVAPPARRRLAPPQRRASSVSGRIDGGVNERGTSGSVERADDGAARARATGGTRRRPRPASSRPADLPDQGAAGVPGDPAALPAGVASTG